MVDTSQINLVELISHDTRLKKAGQSHVGPCPFGCPGDRADHDGFIVWPDGFKCRKCGKQGDAITYVQMRDNLSFPEALDVLGLKNDSPSSNRNRPPSPARTREKPPVTLASSKDWTALNSEKWQSAADTFVQQSRETLWSPEGEKALAWLHERGLTDPVIESAGLGFNPYDRREPRELWGLPSDTGDRSSVWLPKGIVIPWHLDGQYWRVNIRRPVGDPKYIGPSGIANGLYRGDRITYGCTVVMVEGEFDALSVLVGGGPSADIVPVATGSAQGSHLIKWVVQVAVASRVLLAFDTDQAGEQAAEWWGMALNSKTRRLVPTRHDVNEMLQAGEDIGSWIAGALA